ncbi:MAG: hypothetical protein EOP84_16475 [Verrucomicrobiaceae bacterium]|nr:MAG: hypothetical protein EOP84_16475 [Verrucomicrobiaceae bacterium]
MYVFAVNESNEATPAEFSLKDFSDGSAEVIDGGRNIDIEQAKFADEFGAYDVRLYKIPFRPEH